MFLLTQTLTLIHIYLVLDKRISVARLKIFQKAEAPTWD